MKINTESISGYSEMSADEKVQALEAFEYEDHTDEMERLRSATTKANSEAAEWKRKHNALLSEDEKKKQEDAEALSALQSELQELRKDKVVAEYTAKFVAQGYDAALAEDTAKAMADGDMEKVFSNGEKYKAALEKKIKADLMSGTPKPGGSGGEGKTEDAAVAKAREIAKARHGGEATYNDILSKYKK